ncbi:M23 family metallopeptidase [Spirochaeta dissipatitropha]
MIKKENNSIHRFLFVVAGMAAVILAVSGCRSPEIVPDEYEPDASYDDYLTAMQRLGIADSSIGSEWIISGDPEQADPLAITLPFSEQRLIDNREQYAAWYLIEGVRGHRIDIDIDGPAEASYFLDVFRLPEDYRPDFTRNFTTADSNAPWRTGLAEIAVSAGGVQEGQSHLHFEPRRHRWYLVRLQPRLLEGGEFGIRIHANAALSWPVPGTDHRAIWSVYGASRDGGTRVHHGVDIFAPRHTELISISEESTVRVGERDRGGLTVNLTDEKRGLMLYYAHLETQEEDLHGSRIPTGTVIGTMGNTGNAITTPPHLHIGIYEGSWRAPVDPWYFIVPIETKPVPAAQISSARIGEFIRLPADVPIFSTPSQQSSIIPSPAITDGNGQRLPSSAYPTLSIPARIIPESELNSDDLTYRFMGITGDYMRIRLNSRSYGFISAENFSG